MIHLDEGLTNTQVKWNKLLAPIEARQNPTKVKVKIALPRREQTVKPNRITAFYRSYDWKEIRYRVLLKYGRKCMCCGASEGDIFAYNGDQVVINVDHIKPLRKYWSLRLDFDNLQVLCSDCNHGKGNWDETDFRPRPKENILRYRPRLVDNGLPWE
jgi:5-methylcytosine-specific restriction endonuclease McrA